MNDTEENKNYVTPYAFGVNDSLLGKALASPSRRLFSFIVDMAVVGSLTLMSTTIMAASIFIVSGVGLFKGGNKDAHDGTQTWVPRIFIAAAVISAIVLGASLIGSSFGFDSGSAPANIAATVEEQVGNEVEKTLDVVAWLQDTLMNLGSSFGWAAIYFSTFTAWFNGQTFGKVLFRIRVLKIDGKELSLWDSFGRYGGYSAGLATGLLGFLQIIWDPNRQAIHDKISETVVLDLLKPDRVL
ncbi:MAG: putative RDD family membrane protein YckC [Arenicella sp.]|jgi:uncharacterized RDD family membrane protein YckC